MTLLLVVIILPISNSLITPTVKIMKRRCIPKKNGAEHVFSEKACRPIFSTGWRDAYKQWRSVGVSPEKIGIWDSNCGENTTQWYGGGAGWNIVPKKKPDSRYIYCWCHWPWLLGSIFLILSVWTQADFQRSPKLWHHTKAAVPFEFWH